MDQAVSVEENVESSSKRSAENGAVPASKRPRCGEMKRVAEMVLVLSAMGRIRGGAKSPTEAEVRLMAEAREMLADMCTEIAPKDIVGRDAVGAVIEELGLNGKSKEQRLGFRASRLTISEKLALSQKKMEDPKKIHTPSPAYTSQSLQPSVGGSSQTLRGLPSERPSHAAVSSGAFSVSSTPAHASTAASTPLSHQLQTYTVSATLPGGQLGKDFSPFSVPRGDRSHVKVEGGPNVQFVSPVWPMQPQSTAMARSGQESKVLNPGITRADGTADFSMSRMAPQAAREQSSRPFVSQTASGTFPSVHQPVQAPLYVNNHNEIAKIVQKLLHPMLPEYPTWTPPSREYMNKPMTCQLCKVTINEVETVLLCDACEKGFHLKCLQPTSQKNIPRGEWHCMKCLLLSNGKPLPPKYGRVMRSLTPQKGPFNTSAAQSMTAEAEQSSEKKFGIMDQKFTSSFSGTVAQPIPAEAEQSSVKKTENPDQNAAQHSNGTPAVSTSAIGQPSPAENDLPSETTSVQFSTSAPPSYLEKKFENPNQKITQPSGTTANLSTTLISKAENPDQNAGQPIDRIPAHSSVAEAEVSCGMDVENPYQKASQQIVAGNENPGIQVSSALCPGTHNLISASEDPLVLIGKETEVCTEASPNTEDKSLGTVCALPSDLSSKKEVENPDKGVSQQILIENENSSSQVPSVSSTSTGHPGFAPDWSALYSLIDKEPESPSRSEKPPGDGFGSPARVTSSEKDTEDVKVSPPVVIENSSSQVPSVSSTSTGLPGFAPDWSALFSLLDKAPESPSRSEKPPGDGFGSPARVTFSEKDTEDVKVSPPVVIENQSSGSRTPSAPSVLGIVGGHSISAPESEDPLSSTEKEPGVCLASCENISGKPLDAGSDSQSLVLSSEQDPEHSEKVESSISEERKDPITEGDPWIESFNQNNDMFVLSENLQSFQDTPAEQQNCDEVAPSSCQSPWKELEDKTESSEDHDSASKKNQQETGTEILAGTSKPDIVTTMEDGSSLKGLHSAEDVAAE